MVKDQIFLTNQNKYIYSKRASERNGKTRTGSGALSMASEAFALSMSNTY